MTILVTGAGGQVGRALRSYFPAATFLTRAQFDITDAAKVRAYNWRDVKVIINAGASTDVDGAETAEGVNAAFLANALGVAHLADMAAHYGIVFIHFSTDYVFDGQLNRPYRENDTPNPISNYGRSKLQGDSYVQALERYYLLRTSGVYFEGGKNFPTTILRLALAGQELAVADFQLVRPTYAGDLARTVLRLLRNRAAFGTYNCQNSGPPVTWRQVAEKVLDVAGIEGDVRGLRPDEYKARFPKAAPRPNYSVLDLAKLERAGIRMPDWQTPLAEVVPKILQTLRAQT